MIPFCVPANSGLQVPPISIPRVTSVHALMSGHSSLLEDGSIPPTPQQREEIIKR